MKNNIQESHEITATKAWLEEIIVGLNFCPFAKKEMVNNAIYYYQSAQNKIATALLEIIEQCHFLRNNPKIETSLLIYDRGFKNFNQYIDLVDYANDLLVEQGFEGEFQLASFHPEYCFADANFDDAANFTNRSPYPMLHLIREKSMEKVLSTYKNPEQIPDNNIALARSKGKDYFLQRLAKIKHTSM